MNTATPDSNPVGDSLATEQSTDVHLQERYGAPRKKLSPQLKRWLIAIALLASLALAVYVTTANSVSQVTSKDVGYIIESDTQAAVDFEVTKDFDQTVQCAVHILDSSYAVVGAKIVTIGPHEGSGVADRSQYLRTELRTESRGVSGTVDGCWNYDNESTQSS